MTYWNNKKKDAFKRGIDFNITEEYAWNIFEKQSKKCALSGVDIVFAKNKKDQATGVTTASLDRIDSSKGYIENNIQWLHKWVNVIKYDFSQEEFIDWCRKVVEFQDSLLSKAVTL